MRTLAEVLAEHADMTDRSARDGCWCDKAPNPADYNAHLEAAVLDWLRERLAGAREGVALAVAKEFGGCHAPDDEGYGDDWTPEADAALAVVAEALGVGEVRG